jgi:hypothetical protein
MVISPNSNNAGNQMVRFIGPSESRHKHEGERRQPRLASQFQDTRARQFGGAL